MNAECPRCGESVAVTEASGSLPYLDEHQTPSGVRCYGSSKPVERSAVSGKRAPKKTAKRAAKKSAGK